MRWGAKLTFSYFLIMLVCGAFLAVFLAPFLYITTIILFVIFTVSIGAVMGFIKNLPKKIVLAFVAFGLVMIDVILEFFLDQRETFSWVAVEVIRERPFIAIFCAIIGCGYLVVKR